MINVNDRQPPLAKADVRANMNTLCVRSATHDGLAHCVYQVTVTHFTIESAFTGYSTHDISY